MITRRCSERRFFLRPDALVTQIFLYCLGTAAAMFGVQLHAFVAMSNHYHLELPPI
jgi:REP element-mobilizing transposase RayT